MKKLTNFIEYGQNIFVHKSCQIDSDVSIDPFVTIGPNVVIGKGSKISSHVVIGTAAEMPGEDEKNDFTVLEQNPLENLANSGNLNCYRHNGFWHPMDSLRDKRILEKMWNENKAPWMKLVK